MAKQSQTTSWFKLMSWMWWSGINNWKDVNEEKFQEELSKCQQWCIDNLQYLSDHLARTAFKAYYFGEGLSTPYEYTKKNSAECALQTLYNYQVWENAKR